MDPKYVRSKVETLLAELERNPALGRRRSPSFMSRYGRPLGLGLALGVSGAVGCSGSSESTDALPAPKDAYGVSDLPAPPKDARPNSGDVYGSSSDLPADRPDVAFDTPPYFTPVDAYGIVPPDVPPYRPVDAPEAGIPDGSADVKDAPRERSDLSEALAPPIDAYGVMPDRPSDSPIPDAGRDARDAGDAD